jgi:ABC-type polysaccharide/polyol phosphate transport system ATPase subunit
MSLRESGFDGLDAAVEVTDLSKTYSRDLRRAQRNGVASIVDDLFRSGRKQDQLRSGEFWAIRDVSFRVERGEALGIVGRNGAGKSTLLRLVAGISRLTTGEITRRGRVGMLLDPSAGFNMVLSGRENAEVSYTLLAGSGPDAATMASIVAFAGIGDAIEHPVRTYSQGMRLRLGFSSIVHVEPEILMIDEALAVGDAAFQLQCLDYLRSFIKAGGSLVFVSHSLWLFQTLATRGIHLEGGQIAFAGSPSDVADDYVAELKRGSWVETGDGPDLMDRERPSVAAAAPAPRNGTHGEGTTNERFEAEVPNTETSIRPVSFVEARVTGHRSPQPISGGRMEVSFSLTSREPVVAAELAFTIWTADLTVCLVADHGHGLAGNDGRAFAIPAEGARITCRIDRLPIAPGRYAIRAAVYDEPTSDILGMLGLEDSPLWFEVKDREPDDGSAPGRSPRVLRTVDLEILNVLPSGA